MCKYRLLIFDLDDTLFDYKETEILALKKTLECLNIPYTEEYYQLYRKANNEAKKMVDNYILNFPLFRHHRVSSFLNSINKSDVSINHFISLMLEASERGILIDNVFETVSKITINKVIGTNGTTHPRLNKLNNSIIAPYFSNFYSSEFLGCAKPDPNFFIKICQMEGIDLNEVAVIGDNYYTDGLGAKNAGIKSFIINSSKQNNNDSNIILLENMSDLLKWLD